MRQEQLSMFRVRSRGSFWSRILEKIFSVQASPRHWELWNRSNYWRYTTKFNPQRKSCPWLPASPGYPFSRASRRITRTISNCQQICRSTFSPCLGTWERCNRPKLNRFAICESPAQRICHVTHGGEFAVFLLYYGRHIPSTLSRVLCPKCSVPNDFATLVDIALFWDFCKLVKAHPFSKILLPSWRSPQHFSLWSPIMSVKTIFFHGLNISETKKCIQHKKADNLIL